jgi:glyoxylase I family protein
MELTGLQHVAICVKDLDAALRFYVDVLGLEEIERPDFGFPGAWLTVGGHADQMVHLMESADPPPTNFQHFALSCPDLEDAKSTLAAHGFSLSDPSPIPGHGRQSFVNDPSGNVVELNEPARR